MAITDLLLVILYGSYHSSVRHHQKVIRECDTVALINTISPAIDPDNRHQFKPWGNQDGWIMYPHRHDFLTQVLVHACDEKAFITVSMRRNSEIDPHEVAATIDQTLKDAGIV